MNANMMIESEMLTSTLEREMRKIIIRAQREVLEVCAKEYNFDINAAMLLVNAGVERKVVKERKTPTASSGIAKEKVVKEPKEKKERAKKAVKEFVEGSKRNSSRGRPKNPEKVVEVEETENLFEQLVNTQLEQVEEDVACCVVFQTKEEKKTEESGEKMERGLMSVQEKETKVVNKAEAKEQEKLAKLEAKESEKLAKLEAKESEKLAKEAEKASAIANAKLAKEAEKLAKEQAKEAEKLAKESDKLAKEQAKEQEKLAKEELKKSKKMESGSDSDTSSKSVKKTTSKKTKEPTASSGIASKKTKETAERVAKEENDVEYQAKMNDLSKKLEASAVIPVEVVSVMATASSKEPTASGIAASAPATLKVKSFKFEGVTYFREKNTGAIYDKETNDHLGQWNEATQKIDFLEPEEELEEEEESDGESSDEEEEEEEEESA
jgi:hypothetical protein